MAELAVATSRAIDQLRATDPATLLDPREVGRQLLPSNGSSDCWCTAASIPRDMRDRLTLRSVGAEC